METILQTAQTATLATRHAEWEFLDFFAGSGLVTLALKPYFKAVWANDLSAKKQSVYVANHGWSHFLKGDIANITGKSLPGAHLSWASFPCQDLSLAGRMGGLSAPRSGLFWEWLRIMDEMPIRPQLLALENVTGLVSANNGQNYREIHNALLERGYMAGAIMLDAENWVPQSRPRIFVVAAPIGTPIEGLCSKIPIKWLHPNIVTKAAIDLRNFVWWKLPKPDKRSTSLQDILDGQAKTDDEEKSRHVLSLISPSHQSRLLQELTNGFIAAPGYRRIRGGKQVLELRFDGIAGCLRTPKGGSSRQIIVERREGKLVTRLLTVRETARLMGVPDNYQIPGSYNDGYMAMGDAVAVPVVHSLAKHLLEPLASRIYK